MTDEKNALRSVRPDMRLLLALSRLRLTEAQREEIRDILTTHEENLDWGHFIDQASRHAVLPLVSRNLTRYRLTHSEDGRPLVPYRWLYADVYEGGRRRNLALGDEYGPVFRRFGEAGLKFAIRKGPVLGEKIYRDIGTRRMADLDILLHREDVPLFESIASELGYRQGKMSANGMDITPYDRQTQLFWKVSLTNVSLPYVKLGHHDGVEMFILSGCFSLFQPISGVQSDGTEILDRAVPTTLYGEPAHMLDPVDQIIDACVQLHVEATLLYYIESGKDVTIRKFLDVAEILKAAPDAYLPALAERVQKYDCGDSIYYALHYTEQVYPDAVPAGLKDNFRPDDLTFLDEYGNFDGERHRWDCEFADRLFDPKRSNAVRTQSKVPGPRSGI